MSPVQMLFELKFYEPVCFLFAFVLDHDDANKTTGK